MLNKSYKCALVLNGSFAGVSLVVAEDGSISDIGRDVELIAKYGDHRFGREIDATDCCVLPGFVDAHTHPVWDGDRVHEFALKLAGATYMDIHEAGGGIAYTVKATRRASEERLYDLLRDRLAQMTRAGTTLVECKSGYGLDKESEMKMLRVIERARRDARVGISATYCGAHSIPKGMTEEDATDDVIHVQLPEMRRMMARGELHVDNVDVFCEKGVFGVESTRRILGAGKEIGLQINFHGDELHPMGAAELGVELGAHAISHLEEISADGIRAMAESDSVAVLLPTTAYILRLKQPPAREMIEKGVIVALGSDFNPNAYCLSMPLVMHLACVNMRLTLAEALAAATINAAAALGQSDKRGSIEVGKMADLVIIKAPRWEHIVYQFGCHSEVIKHVIKDGRVIVE